MSGSGIQTAVSAIEIIYMVASGVIIADVLLSWIPPIRDTVFGRFVSALASPMLSPVRKLVARSPLGGPGMALDFSPIVTLLLLRAVTSLAEQIIRTL